jgi:hypothetical protein
MTMAEQSPTRYPDSWRPPGAPPFDEPEPEPETKSLELELRAAQMNDAEWAAFVKRARGGRDS